MKRLELFEFEDFPWLPDFIRSGVTNLIIVFHRLMGTSELLTDLILNIRKRYHFDQIVDMGSGSGGPMPAVIEKINRETPDNPMHLLLTDMHPHAEIVDKINGLNSPHVRYQSTPLNATDLKNAPDGLKTMIASFHHMKPADAKAILDAAKGNKQPILIYELAENNIPVIVWWMLLPLSLTILIVMSLVMTVFVRPLTFRQILFTYVIPIIPLVYAWDGQASIMRTYTFADLAGLTGDRSDDHYVWEMAKAYKPNGKQGGYYVFGYKCK